MPEITALLNDNIYPSELDPGLYWALVNDNLIQRDPEFERLLRSREEVSGVQLP